ncbi:MAG: sulfite exporter TauE/SafE family protein [Rikenellaceae bacterium]
MVETIVNLLPDPRLWLVLIGCSVLVGFCKTGIAVVGTAVVPIMALAFGARPSTGLLLPLLCIADLGAIIYYRRSCSWYHLVRLLGWAIVGLFVGIAIDHFVPLSMFKYLLAFTIMISAVVLLVNEFGKRKNIDDKPQKGWVLSLYGILGGFATMIANAAGPIMSVYLLSIKMPKMLFVGTSAWFFMLLNYTKLPLQIWVWDNIHLDYILASLVMIPFVALGSWLGIILVKKIPDNIYRHLVIWITLASSVVILF